MGRRGHTTRALGLAMSVAALGLGAVPAAAQTAPPAEPATAAAPSAPADVARHRYDQGVEAFRARLFVEAAEHFTAAYEADPAPTLLYNLARALEEQGEAGKAATRFEEYLQRYPQAQDAGDVGRRLAALRAVARGNAPGRVTVEGLPPDAVVFVDDRAVDMAEAPRWTLSKGEHAVRVERPGYAPLRVTVQVRPDGDATVAWVATAPVVANAPPPAPEKPFPFKPVIGWGLVGLGAVAVGFGFYAAGEAADTLDQFNALTGQVQGQQNGPEVQAKLNERETLRGRQSDQTTLAYGLWGAGAALVAGGVTLVLIDALSDDEPETEGRVSVGVAPGWLGLSGTF